MADEKTPVMKEYIIPLRREWRKVANYRRTSRAVKTIKLFIARHMKIPDRDVSKVKLDVYLNQEVWFRGRKKPPAKIKVRAIKEEGIVKVELVDIPQELKFKKIKQEKRHKAAPEVAKPKASEKEEKKEDKKSDEESSEDKKEKEEKKKESDEKSQAAAEQKEGLAKQQAQIQKHASMPKETPIHRKALKK